MVEYSNPQLPEDINVTPEHPLKEFAQLSIGIGVLIIAVIVTLTFGIGVLAKFVPFRFEARLSERFVSDLPARGPIGDYLQGLADRLARAARLPADMPITVHYLDDATVNAMATVGGHVLVYRGLLAQMDHENGLALVLAHEIAHVQHRDPIVSLGRGMVLGLAISAVASGTGSDLAARALGQAGLLTALSFNRGQERAADRVGLAAVAAIYGHVSGADAFFRKLLESPASRLEALVPEFLHTHPLTPERVQALATLATANGWQNDQPLTLFPAEVAALRKERAALGAAPSDESTPNIVR